MKDYYKILGIDKSASKEDIKKAFRKLAHEHHPDKNKGNDAASAKFKEASEAYSVLSDDAKRQQYDTFGSAGPGFGGGQGAGFGGANGFGGFDFSGFARQAGQQGGFGGNGQSFEFDLGDIFSEFFGGGGARRPRRGRNITLDIQLTFKESVFGIEREVSNGKEKFSVKIPSGMEAGQGLRIPGKGEQGEGGPGDLIVRVWIEEDSKFRRENFNIIMDLQVKLTMALAGGTVTVDTIDGAIELKIPNGTAHGEILRVKGRGVPMTDRGIDGRRGDLLIIIRIEMPRKLSKTAAKLIDELRAEGL